MVLRASLVVITTGLCTLASQAGAQYYPPGPTVYRGPPIPVEEVDNPDIYTPAPPPSYGRRAPDSSYPYEAAPPSSEPRVERQALPAPAPGTNFPPPTDYQWLRERGGYAPTARPEPMEPDTIPTPGVAGRPPAVANPGAPNSTVAALPPDYQPEQGTPKELPPQFKRQLVDYVTKEPAGTIIIDTPHTYLYLVLGNGKAMRYGIGVGREGFTWSGTERISRMSEWPDWHPPKEMIERQPYLPRFMAGGESNPLGARALYLGKTLYRIHGTNQPSTIGSFVSSGCIRLVNQDIEDLYSRVQVGTRVVVLPGGAPPSSSPASASNPNPAAASNNATVVR
jgi:lipoprotein-anchoring transpeptidase ErfK/SrfK